MRKNELHDFIWTNYTKDPNILQLVVNALNFVESQRLTEKDTVESVYSLIKDVGITKGMVSAFIYPKATEKDIRASFLPNYDGPDIRFVRYNGSDSSVHDSGCSTLKDCLTLAASGMLFYYDCTAKELDAWKHKKNIKGFSCVANDEELNKLLKDFNSQLDAAQRTRGKIMDYLEEEYGIDTDAANGLEDECDWCYGVDTYEIERAVERIREGMDNER